MIFNISRDALNFMVRMYLAVHLATSKLIEDHRQGLSGDQVKLVPAPPNDAGKKFRVIQLWDKNKGTVKAATEEEKQYDAVILHFFDRDSRGSNKRRWPLRRPSPLRVDLVEEARKEGEELRKWIEAAKKVDEDVHQYNEGLPQWQREGGEGFSRLPSDTDMQYVRRWKEFRRQKW
jgi:hypothetical protein